MKKKNLLALLLAVVMVFGIMAPAVSFAEPEETTNLNIVKLKLDSMPAEAIDHDGTKKDFDDLANALKVNSVEGLPGVTFTYWKVDDVTKFEKLKDDQPSTEEDVKNILGGVEATGTVTTGEGGLASIKDLVDGNYYFIETKSVDGITGSLAVPFGITLPIYNKDSNERLADVYVYPKNTIDTPTIDKKIDNADNPKFDNGFVGEVKTYKVPTTIPKGSNYERLIWSDSMEKGLTFLSGEGVTLQVLTAEGGTAMDPQPFAENTDYTVVSNESGFTLTFEEVGLTKLADLAENNNVYIELTYKTEINGDAVVEQTMDNHVELKFGRTPGFNTTPKENTPSNGKISVVKTWDEEPAPTNVKVTYYLYEVVTGGKDKVVDQVTIEKSPYAHTFTGLEDSKSYYVKEFIDGYEAEYLDITAAGTIEIKNHKTPDVLQPEPPKLVTGGRRFQKVDELENNGLKGATFVITNEDGTQYLALKDADEQAQDQAAYDKAEAAYQEAVKTSAPNVDTLKEARDEAYRATGTKYKWMAVVEGDNKYPGAYEVTSGESGYFKVTGLAYGKYNLVEITPPDNYAILTNPQPFTVSEKSFDEVTVVEQGEGLDPIYTDDGLTAIVNKKVTIPQTGGMGTIVLTVAGIALMATAVIALRRNRAMEE